MSYSVDFFPPEAMNYDRDELELRFLEGLMPAISNREQAWEQVRNLYPEFEVTGERELSHPNGLQVSFDVDSIYINVPYWYQEDAQIRHVFEIIQNCAQAIEQTSGLVAFDSQIGRYVQLPDDLETMIYVYKYTIGRINDVIL